MNGMTDTESVLLLVMLWWEPPVRFSCSARLALYHYILLPDCATGQS